MYLEEDENPKMIFIKALCADYVNDTENLFELVY